MGLAGLNKVLLNNLLTIAFLLIHLRAKEHFRILFWLTQDDFIQQGRVPGPLRLNSLSVLVYPLRGKGEFRVTF